MHVADSGLHKVLVRLLGRIQGALPISIRIDGHSPVFLGLSQSGSDHRRTENPCTHMVDDWIGSPWFMREAFGAGVRV